MRLARRLVVNADDFGISRGVNRGIIDAYRDGIVTSASLMPNLEAAEDALTRAAAYPDLQLGLHLTLTAGRPLSPPDRVPSLVDVDGRLMVLGELLARLSIGRVRRVDLERELTAQVEWASRHGLRPDHLDSHHHVHLHPRVAEIVLGLARQHRIPFVRCPVERPTIRPLIERRAVDAARTVAISLLGRRFRQRARAAGLQMSDHFRGIALGTGFDVGGLTRVLRRLPAGLTELMTHPGFPDDELRQVTVFAEGRDRELAALTSPEAASTIRRAGIALTTFRDAPRPGPYT